MGVTNQALPSGYQLLNYRIDRQISRGGFSIVYRAFDDGGGPVAIKEYLPSSLVLRTEGDIVRASTAENLTSFRYGMKCFFEEGRALAKINHPNVVRVLDFFRANETVYMVMRYERGRTLQQQIQMRQDQVSERLVRHVFMHLLNGLREVHTHKLLHLDIKPANIYLRTDGSPVLLDFGAARQTLTSNRPKLAPMPRRVRFTIFEDSRKGQRKINQDRLAYTYSRDTLLLVVADGMGGHAGGEIAAQIAVRLFIERFQQEAKPTLTNPLKFLQDSMQRAHQALGSYAKQFSMLETPRTTCVAG